jgi:hypothetical protein
MNVNKKKEIISSFKKSYVLSSMIGLKYFRLEDYFSPSIPITPPNVGTNCPPSNIMPF